MILTNMWKLAGYGALVICYIWALNWSLNTFVYVKRKRRQNRPKTKYSWDEIASIPVYFITWGVLIFMVFIIIGAIVNFIIEVITMFSSFEPIAVTLFSPFIL